MTNVVHRYQAGERVVFHAPTSLGQFAGAYLIERLLPSSDSGPTYLIKRVKDGHERVAAERELSPVMAVVPAKPRRRARRPAAP